MGSHDLLDELLQVAREATPEALAMSRQDCHARQVSSMVVGRMEVPGESEPRLLRVTLVWPEHDLHANAPNPAGGYAIGVHDSRSKLKLRMIHGTAQVHLYQKSERGVPIRKMSFRSPLAHGQIRVTGANRTAGMNVAVLRCTSRAAIPDDRWLTLKSHDLHTIWCPAGQMAAWLIEEGRAEKEETRLFTNSPIDTAGFYRPFVTPEHALMHIERFVKMARRAQADPAEEPAMFPVTEGLRIDEEAAP